MCSARPAAAGRHGGLARVSGEDTHPVVDVHSALYNTLLILYLGLTVWALFFIATSRAVDGAFRSTYVLGIVAAVLQGAAGVALYLSDYRPAQNFHYLYGISLVVFTGAGYAFADRASDSRREALYFGLASAAAFGLILRAAATAR
jgi:hypothetical protein